MKAINLVICSCGKYIQNNDWKPYSDIEELILKKVKLVLPKAKVNVKNIELPEKLKEKKDYYLATKIKDKETKILVTIKLSRCDVCSKEGSNYFEAILQIRSANAAVLEEAMGYLNTRVNNLRHRGMFINKIEDFDNGYDLYMTNRKVAQVLSVELQDNFGGKLKVSPRLFTRNKQTSKDVYRVNIFLELPGFARDDIILVDDKLYVVDKIGKRIKLTDLLTGFTALMEYAKMDYNVMKKQPTYVSRTYPSLEVINPLDFQSSMVKNKPKKIFTSGQTVHVIIHKGIYVVD